MCQGSAPPMPRMGLALICQQRNRRRLSPSIAADSCRIWTPPTLALSRSNPESPPNQHLDRKNPILSPVGSGLYSKLAALVARQYRSGNRILRLREEEEPGDQESQANQTEERTACHQGHLCLLWQADLQDWQADKIDLYLPFLFIFS
jgi:hypothetical protein